MRMKKSQWQDVIDLNLTGVFLCTQVLTLPSLLNLLPQFNLSVLLQLLFAGCNESNDEEKEGIECFSSLD